MGVKFKPFASGGDVVPTSFSDDFNRVASTDLGSNWCRLLGNNVVSGGVGPGWGTASITAAAPNQCSIAGIGPNNPTGTIYTAWAPIPVMSSLYNAGSVFAQCTFISTTANIAAGLALRINNAHEAGPISVPNGFDVYFMGEDGQTARIINGGAIVGVGGNAVAVVANNVLRLEAVNSGTSTILTSKVNGTIVNQNTIVAASFPIQRGYPGLLLWSIAGAPPTASIKVIDSYSCGLL